MAAPGRAPVLLASFLLWGRGEVCAPGGAADGGRPGPESLRPRRREDREAAEEPRARAPAAGIFQTGPPRSILLRSGTKSAHPHSARDSKVCKHGRPSPWARLRPESPGPQFALFPGCEFPVSIVGAL